MANVDESIPIMSQGLAEKLKSNWKSIRQNAQLLQVEEQNYIQIRG